MPHLALETGNLWKMNMDLQASNSAAGVIVNIRRYRARRLRMPHLTPILKAKISGVAWWLWKGVGFAVVHCDLCRACLLGALHRAAANKTLNEQKQQEMELAASGAADPPSATQAEARTLQSKVQFIPVQSGSKAQLSRKGTLKSKVQLVCTRWERMIRAIHGRRPTAGVLSASHESSGSATCRRECEAGFMRRLRGNCFAGAAPVAGRKRVCSDRLLTAVTAVPASGPLLRSRQQNVPCRTGLAAAAWCSPRCSPPLLERFGRYRPQQQQRPAALSHLLVVDKRTRQSRCNCNADRNCGAATHHEHALDAVLSDRRAEIRRQVRQLPERIVVRLRGSVWHS